MATIRPCPSCGASNDPLFPQCYYCYTTMPPSKEDLARLSNAEIIQKIVEYTELAGRKGFGTVNAPRKPGRDPERPDYWTRSELLDLGRRYLSLLKERAATEPGLEAQIRELDDVFAAAGKGISGDILVAILLFYLKGIL